MYETFSETLDSLPTSTTQSVIIFKNIALELLVYSFLVIYPETTNKIRTH